VISQAAQTLRIQLVEVEYRRVQELAKKYPFYRAFNIDGGVYRGVDVTTPSVAVLSMWIAAESLSADVVYNMLKATFDNPEFKSIHPNLQRFFPQPSDSTAPRRRALLPRKAHHPLGSELYQGRPLRRPYFLQNQNYVSLERFRRMVQSQSQEMFSQAYFLPLYESEHASDVFEFPSDKNSEDCCGGLEGLWLWACASAVPRADR
jgi:hypothetical protein